MVNICKPQRSNFEIFVITFSFLAAFLTLAQFTGFLALTEESVSPLGDPITSGMAVLLVILAVMLMSRTKL